MINRAILNLRPNAKWVMKNNNYSELDWLDKEQTKPTKKEIEDEVLRIKKEIEDEVLKKDFEDIEKLKEINSLKEYLRDTDFYYVRLSETQELVPADVLEKRLAARLRIRELEDN